MNAERVSIARPTILVVEDEALIREIAAITLSELGYPVIEAASAQEALKLLDDVEILGGMLTDVQMPGMSGVELAQRVSRQFPGAGILVTSGRAAPTPSEMPQGARYIAKPWDSEQLIAAMRRVLPKTLQ